MLHTPSRSDQAQLGEIRPVVAAVAGEQLVSLHESVPADEKVRDDVLSPYQRRLAGSTRRGEGLAAARANQLLPAAPEIGTPRFGSAPK